MIYKLNKNQIEKTNLVNNENSINKKVIDTITLKLKNNKSKHKNKSSKEYVKSNQNDSTGAFENMLLHSEKKKIELFKKNKLKELKNKADQENYKFSNKPLSEINGLMTELSDLFVKPKNIESQFSNDSKDKFIEMIFDNFEDLLDTQEDGKLKDLSNINITNEVQNKSANLNLTEFNPDNYDVLNPLSELTNTENNNPKNLKYNLKDLISIIKNAIENDNKIQKSEIESNINSILISQSKDKSLEEINQKRISELINKNTNELVNEFLPKYFFKSGNSKTKNSNYDINNSNFKAQSDNLINVDFDRYINEINDLEQKLNKLNDNNVVKPNSSLIDDKKNNIILDGENKPTNSIKIAKNNSEKLIINEIDKVNNSDSKDNFNNLNQNLNLESNKNQNINNIIKRANSLEFQTFKNIQLNELNSTTTLATVKTPENTTSMVRITMNPDSLGTVFVEIKMNGDEASINFKSADKEVISTLENNIKELQASLKSENIELKTLVIDYKDYDKELNQENSARNQEEQNNKEKKQENKNLYKDLSIKNQEGINLDSNFYNNLKNYAEQFRENSSIYKDVTNRNSNLEAIKIKTKIIEKYS